MAESGYFEYESVDQSLISSIANFRSREDLPSYDSKPDLTQPSTSHASYYAEQFGNLDPTDALNHHNVSLSMDKNLHVPNTGQDYLSSLQGGADLYSHHVPNSYHGMKAERGSMPPTPPGSPEDVKDLSITMNQSQMLNPAIHQHLLAKPVPMRRLSERRIAQARACLTTVGMTPDPMMEPQHTSATHGVSAGIAPAIARALSATQQAQKRPRSEKKPIPLDMKDDRYFERRKRNNSAAKKSRDARKAREDEIAIRASFLEKENAILRAQVATLREEANSLRQLLLQKRSRP